MTLQIETDATASTGVIDRRRPGRLTHVNPALIPILRGAEPAILGGGADIVFEEPDQMSAARGLVAGLCISVPLWAGIALVGRWLLA